MKKNELFESYGCDTPHRVQGIFKHFCFAKSYADSRRKLQTEISMKQWLLLAMTECCPEPRTLTNIGNLMGCSRQNVKISSST